MRQALVFAAIAEALTGLALVIVPRLVAGLLLGSELTGDALSVARVAGLALIGLGLACWPGPPRLGMIVYGASVGLVLAWFGLTGQASGILLWPAVLLHLLLAVALAVRAGD